AIDRHLQPDHRGLAADRGAAGERLQRPDLEGLGLSEGGAPGRRDQHGGAEHAGAVSDDATPRRLSGVPGLLNVILNVIPWLLFVGHGFPSLVRWVPAGLSTSPCFGVRKRDPGCIFNWFSAAPLVIRWARTATLFRGAKQGNRSAPRSIPCQS